MKLSRSSLSSVATSVPVPPDALFGLPEKVLQFGTGVLLRGLPDYFIDKANKQGIFNGRVVVVKSTSQGDTASFAEQDGLYTICVRGIEGGQNISENIIASAISRALNAAGEWDQVLQCAHNRELQVIISNTTEVGLQLVKEDIHQSPPKSFPGKLLRFLLERYTTFGGSRESGMVVIPTELIPENGTRLKAILLELAQINELDAGFIDWLQRNNRFCDSLVDRIVPGKPEGAPLALLQQELGYSDELLTMAEAYRLWAIEGDEGIKEVLSFADADRSVIIAPDIDIYRELKLRLLNGTHTLSCGLAFLAGCTTVKEAMDDAAVSSFIAGLMQHEIAPAIPYPVDQTAAQEFSANVLDRFRNPFIKHQWLSITLNYSSKLKTRCIPVLTQHYKMNDTPPPLFVVGFAAYLLFMKADTQVGNNFYGTFNGVQYPIQDDQAAAFYRRWASLTPAQLVHEVLQDDGYWGVDLTSFPGFEHAVAAQLNGMLEGGVRQALKI